MKLGPRNCTARDSDLHTSRYFGRVFLFRSIIAAKKITMRAALTLEDSAKSSLYTSARTHIYIPKTVPNADALFKMAPFCCIMDLVSPARSSTSVSAIVRSAVPFR
jgi:hypothetical protein